MARSPTSAHFLHFLVFFFAAFGLGGATDHIVGGHLGWNSNINYTLWSNNQTFLVNDLISFRYQKNMHYNVFEVNKTGYDNCTMDGLAGNWSSGKDFILLDKPKTYYFICGNGLCFSGMKVSVRVQPLPSPPSSSPKHTSASSHAVGSAASARSPALLVLAVAFAAAAWVGLGSGRI